MAEEEKSNPERWETGLGQWLIRLDGSMVRLGELPEEVVAEAKRRGVETPPKYVPKEDAEKWLNWRL